jgi:hypothetical protein
MLSELAVNGGGPNSSIPGFESYGWEELVNDYRYRSLRKPKDRIMASAGLAQVWHKIT